jgi:hypothetical protein
MWQGTVSIHNYVLSVKRWSRRGPVDRYLRSGQTGPCHNEKVNGSSGGMKSCHKMFISPLVPGTQGDCGREWVRAKETDAQWRQR